MRKTSLLRDRSDGPAVRQADMNCGRADASCDALCVRVWSKRVHARLASRPNARSDLLFTMSDITRRRKADKPIDGRETYASWTNSNPLVEPDGIEPTTSCLQSRRSPN